MPTRVDIIGYYLEKGVQPIDCCNLDCPNSNSCNFKA